jgi:dTMP kinase
MLSGKRKATTEQILDLFVMDRKEHVEEKINPALNEGKIVLMDRYYYSTMAYQAAAGIDVNRIRKDNEFAPKPDVVLIFDLPADLAMKRVKGHSVADVFEKEEHLEKVREAYLDLRDDPLVRIIDSTRTPEEIFEEVWKLVSEVRNG